ncbi:hypothetical protein V5J73_08410 [Flavobacterium sp. KS-LB2]|uniref:beta strand repeat-containing protein n=1 Tax=Flavobacterium sp. KS-LB2 TaxID=3120525 RepID=UPI0030CA7C2C
MKKIILLFIFFLCAKSFAQNNGITYQAVILNPNRVKTSDLNNSNLPLVSKDICMLFKFVDEFSNVEYQEIIRTKTDPYGMVNLIIGTGTQTSGYATSFSKISWDSVDKSLVVGINVTGDCSSFTEISNQPFNYVPFAYSAINTVNVTGVVAVENGGTNAITVLGAKTNLGLESVDNTSDLNKPISNATKVALDLKEDGSNKSTSIITDGNSDIKFPSVKSVKTYVDSNISSNGIALTTEINRATTAENTIASNLVSETTRATIAEGTNATAISTETIRATLAETTLTANLATEVARATTAEATKEDAINKSTDGSFTSNSDVKFPTEKATKTYVDGTAATASTALTTEINRATTAENTIASNLVSETTRATIAEGTNATAISTETIRATLAETTLTANLATEVARATTAEATKEDAINKSTDGSFTSNSDVKFPTEKATKTYVDGTAAIASTALTTEINRATTAENTIASNLVSETARATVAEGTNATAISTETTRATLAETTLTANLATEVARATTAEATKEDAANKSTDGTFATNSDVKFPTEKATKTYVDGTAATASTALATEINRATTAENAIAANLVSEITRATVAEGTNATAISTETTRATLAEVTLTANLATEVARATTAEATKEDAVNKSTDGTFATNSDVKFPTEKATKTYVDGTAAIASTALTTEINRATTAENTIASNLVSETARATVAEGTNATAISAETTRATLAEVTLTANLATEVARATTAEATKEDAVNKSTDGTFATNSDVKFPTEKATKTYVDGAAATASTALTTEINRATTTENTIASNLVSETTRATIAEGTNATAISTETTRATLAEVTLTANLATEVARATTAEATKEDAVNKSTDGTFATNSDVKFPTEKATKTYVDASLSSNSLALTNEISRATTAENSIAANLVTESERATLAETTNANAITSETTRATLAETALATNLSTEVNRATAAEATKEDAVNKSTDGSFTSNSDVKFPTEKATKTYVDASASSSSLALTNEISRATLAENTIAANLVSETERATLAEATNATAITAETNRATAAEATKEDTANKSKDGSFTSNSDVKFPTEKATKTYVDAIASSNSLALTNEISRATLAENTIATNLLSETERATLAEANNATAITSETNRATLAETTLATNLDLKANLASPSFTGTPSLPTGTIAVTQSAENNSTAIATTAFVTAANATNANLTGDVTSIGNLTTIATNVITTTKIADSNITNAKLDKANIPLSGFGAATSAVALGNNKLTEVADPTNPQDAATKNYVDALTSTGVTGNGTTNFIPKFSSSSALANSLIFDSGTQIGIGTNAPTSLFQIGGNGSGDNPLKYDYDGGGNGALKFGFRQYEYRIKSNQNSGVLENLTFSYYNQSTGVDSDRFVIANDGIYIPGKLNVTGTVNGGAATLSSLNVNNSQLNVNSSTNTVGFFTDSPTSKFQIGGDGNFDNPLKYDYGYGSGEGALKFGFRQNEFRIKTNQNSGVLEKLTFSYYKNADGTDIESMHIDNNGLVSITKLAVTAGSPGNGKVLTSDAFGNASWVAPVVASSNEFVDLTTTQTIAGAKTFSSTVTGNSFVKSGGTSAQYLMADGSVSTGAAPVREVADETSAAASQDSFTLTQTPSINSKVKMYVNGIRISNAAYSVSGTTLTYIPANNGSYTLSVNDRVQFDYFY